MNTETFTTTILTPSEGHKLTQSDESIALRDRIVADRIALGRHDSAENWKEISNEEAEAIIAEQQKEQAEEAEKKEED